MREEKTGLRDLGKYFRERKWRCKFPAISALGQLWVELVRAGEAGRQGVSELGRWGGPPVLLSLSCPSLQLAYCWSVEARPGEVISVTWRGRTFQLQLLLLSECSSHKRSLALPVGVE